jgi:PAS domain S-box-containing protein
LIYRGVLNVGTGELACRSLIGTVHRDGANLIVAAEFDVAERERLEAQVKGTNEELAEAQRELARHKRDLTREIAEHKRTGAELDLHRHRLQERVNERTQQLQQVNAALVEGQRFIRTAADNLPGLLAYWDKDLRCRFANRAYREWFNRSEQELDGIALHELLTPQLLEDNMRFLPTVLNGEAQRFQTLRFAPNGRAIHGLATYIPDVVDGDVRGFLVLVADVTEIKRAELRLQEINAELVVSRDKAEAANRAKSVFLANMSHEIRTPMNAIIGLTHVMRRDAREPAQVARLDKVAEAAGHLLNVINDILDLSKIEAGKLHLEHTEFSLAAVLTRTRGLVLERAREKGLAVVLEIDAVPDALRGDSTRLSQALLNLLSNAVKFTAEGRVLLRAGLLRQDETTVQVRFSVHDTGIGIPHDQIDQLFAAFAQADTSTTRRFGGTGLGLAITKRLVGMMAGEVGVNSEPGVGSEFWFTAIFERGAHAAREQATAPADADAEAALRQQYAGAHVLLVEDNPVNQEVAVQLLRAVGLRVDTADNGLEAIERVRAVPYELILMDLQMPEMDGLEATRCIRGLPGHATTPILALTANAFGEDRAACLVAGMDDHVAKPVDPAVLYGTLLRWLPARFAGDMAQVASRPPNRDSTAHEPGDDTTAPVISGLDVDLAIHRLGGRADLFWTALLQFARHYGDGLADVERQLACNDLAVIRRLAHSIRGASATIGATRLPHLAEALEHACQRTDTAEVAQAGHAMLRELVLLTAAIRACGADRDSPSTPRTAAVPTESLDRLEALLASADYAAQAQFRAHATALRQQFGAPALEVETRLAAFDYEQALAALRTMRSVERC